MRPWLILINDFSHDLFTGLWFGSFVTVLVLRGRVGDPVLLAELTRIFTILCLSSLIAILLTGIFRFFYYRNWDSVEMAAIIVKAPRRPACVFSISRSSGRTIFKTPTTSPTRQSRFGLLLVGLTSLWQPRQLFSMWRAA